MIILDIAFMCILVLRKYFSKIVVPTFPCYNIANNYVYRSIQTALLVESQVTRRGKPAHQQHIFKRLKENLESNLILHQSGNPYQLLIANFKEASIRTT